jgi:parvulin-like peptidyl-prolyl isomerase
LPPFDATGASDEGAEEFDADFVAEAYGLRQPGETSEVAETRFGWHVIRLLERVQPDLSKPPPPALRDAVVEMRARQRLRAALKRQRSQIRVDLSTGAEARMAEVVAGIL